MTTTQLRTQTLGLTVVSLHPVRQWSGLGRSPRGGLARASHPEPGLWPLLLKGYSSPYNTAAFLRQVTKRKDIHDLTTIAATWESTASWGLDPFPPIFYFFPIPITSVVSKTSQLCKMDLVRNFKLSFIKECADSQKKSLLFQRVSIWNPQMLVSQLLNVLICVKPKTHCRNPLRNGF